MCNHFLGSIVGFWGPLYFSLKVVEIQNQSDFNESWLMFSLWDYVKRAYGLCIMCMRESVLLWRMFIK